MKSVFKKIVVFILALEAKLVLRKYKPKIVAITGSVGKTSTKDAIYTALGARFFVRRSEKSFNSEIGVPLTILGVPNAWSNPLRWIKNFIDGFGIILFPTPYPEWLVLEVGADRPGDIKKVTKWIEPHIAVLTSFPDVPVHVEFFDSPEAVREEKTHLANGMREGGTLVLNADDAFVYALRNRVQAGQLWTFGFSKEATVRATEEELWRENDTPIGLRFAVEFDGKRMPITVRGGIGRQHIYPVLAALSVGLSRGIEFSGLVAALSKHAVPPGRMRLLSGIEETTIIDDTYNSSPIAAGEALATLRRLNTDGRKVAVLGDMLELGTYSVAAHEKMGTEAADSCGLLITVGIRSRTAAESARRKGMRADAVIEYEDSRRLAKEARGLIQKGDTVLVKGSQSVRMERVVAELLAHPEEKEKLLVRQSKEWLAKE